MSRMSLFGGTTTVTLPTRSATAELGWCSFAAAACAVPVAVTSCDSVSRLIVVDRFVVLAGELTRTAVVASYDFGAQCRYATAAPTPRIVHSSTASQCRRNGRR